MAEIIVDVSKSPADNPSEPVSAPIPFHEDGARGIQFHLGDSLAKLAALCAQHPNGVVDAVFADPPYFLSNDGITCQSGRMVSVNKAQWDRSRGAEENHEFNLEWLRLCQSLLKPNGTIWVTGTHHVIFSVGYAMQQLGCKILNVITWEKPNPPPNLSCRYFTHSTEQVLWAAKSAKSRHTFHYPLMKELNGGRQMKSVWPILAPGRNEKRHGKHPTQKPLALVERCLAASTNEGDLVLDPFLGSGTTAVACVKLGRRCIGIESDVAHLAIAVRRLPSPQLPLRDSRRPAKPARRR
jgi:site-specific DNA-methyltransferase (adenine-specific)